MSAADMRDNFTIEKSIENKQGLKAGFKCQLLFIDLKTLYNCVWMEMSSKGIISNPCLRKIKCYLVSPSIYFI